MAIGCVLWKIELQKLANELRMPICCLLLATRHQQMEQDRATAYFRSLAHAFRIFRAGVHYHPKPLIDRWCPLSLAGLFGRGRKIERALALCPRLGTHGTDQARPTAGGNVAKPKREFPRPCRGGRNGLTNPGAHR
jgi:hypothetical protein